MRATLRLVWRSSPLQTAALAVFTLVAGLIPLGIAYVGKRIVDGVVAQSRPETVRWVVVEPRPGRRPRGRHAWPGSGSERARRPARHRHQRRHPREGPGPRPAVVRGLRVLRQAHEGTARGVVPSHRPRHRGLQPRAERGDPRRLCDAPPAVQRLGRARPVRGHGARDHRRDALLEAGLPGAKLALARVSAPALPRVRPRQRRAREGSEALRSGADAPGPLQAAVRGVLRRRTAASTSSGRSGRSFSPSSAPGRSTPPTARWRCSPRPGRSPSAT